jgi:hypothetical protein
MSMTHRPKLLHLVGRQDGTELNHRIFCDLMFLLVDLLQGQRGTLQGRHLLVAVRENRLDLRSLIRRKTQALRHMLRLTLRAGGVVLTNRCLCIRRRSLRLLSEGNRTRKSDDESGGYDKMLHGSTPVLSASVDGGCRLLRSVGIDTPC